MVAFLLFLFLVISIGVAARARRRGFARRGSEALVVAAVLLSMPLSVFAQAGDPGQDDQSSLLWDITKGVAFDPTTYTPALVSYGATRLDWNSSQVFFRNGFVEANPRFTVSGLSYDRPISHAAGNKQILKDAIGILQISAANNLSAHLIERVLIKRYPNQRKLLRTLGWIERIGFSSYWSYRLSAGHFRAWQQNQRLARQLEYK